MPKTPCQNCGVLIDWDMCIDEYCPACGVMRDVAQAEDITNPQEVIKKAIDIAIQYGGIDGGHHKMWVIDQMLRILAGKDYDKIIAESCEGEDGPNTYEHDVGIAP